MTNESESSIFKLPARRHGFLFLKGFSEHVLDVKKLTDNFLKYIGANKCSESLLARVTDIHLVGLKLTQN